MALPSAKASPTVHFRGRRPATATGSISRSRRTGRSNDKANLTSCYECHKPFAKDDCLTNLANLAGSFPSTAQVTAKSGPAEVTISGFSFGPCNLAVAQGQRVTLTNADDTSHVIAIAGKDRRSDLMLKGRSSTLQFDEAGTAPDDEGHGGLAAK